MGSNLNFNGLGVEGGGGDSGSGSGGGRPPGNNYLLVRQSSVYALTFEEFQSSMMGGVGKDFGSMNMDELLKNIWSAEETQTMVGSGTGTGSGGGATGGGGIGVSGGYLARQGSLTLPRTLSTKTVDEVWRDMSGVGGSNMPQTQRQQTLGEITLEEFLVRAGVVREDNQLPLPEKSNVSNNNPGYFGDLSRGVNQSELGYGYQETGRSNATGLMGGKILDNGNHQIAMQSAPNLPLNVNGARSGQQQQQQQPTLFPKQPVMAYGASMTIQNNGGMGMVGFGGATGSPVVSSDGLGKSNEDLSSVSPVPYVFNGGLRGRRSSGLEKVVERRQRRMIKNRESAARSRARKQAYTMELEAEVAKLKQENEELRKRQVEIMEMQKNQVDEMKSMEPGDKRRCLRRTQTGPW